MMRALVRGIAVLVLGSPAFSQVALRLLENPVQGASGEFGVSGPPRQQFLFALASADGGRNQLSAFDPRDLRTLGFDIQTIVFAMEGAFDAAGLAQVTVPGSYLTRFRTSPFFAQVLTFPGPATTIDALSNTVSQRVGTGSGDLQGLVLDETNAPLVGALVSLVGNSARSTSTGTAGQFTLTRLPAGRQHVAVDARHVQAPPGYHYPRVEIQVDVADGLVTTVPFTVYLPKATGGRVVPAGVTTSATTVTAPTPEGNLELVIAANTNVRYQSGTLSTEPVTLVRVDTTRTPMPMPRDLRPKWDFAVYPPGVSFSEPADVTLVTDEALEIGSEWDLMRPNHEDMTFVKAGRMRAAARQSGGTVLTLIPNSGPGGSRGGVIGGGWHSVSRPPDPDPFDPPWPPCPPGTCCEKNKALGSGCTVDLDTGDLRGEVSTPTYLVGGREERLTLVYRSRRAHPALLLHTRGRMPATSMVPNYISLEASLGSLTATPTFYSPSAVGNGAHSLVTMLDALSVASGVHSCEVMSRSHYGESNFAAIVNATHVVENYSTSPFGAGWTLAGLDRIVTTPQGPMLSRGTGEFLRFTVPAGSGTLAGNGTPGTGGNGGRAEFAQLSSPTDLVADSQGRIYVLDAGSASVRLIERSGIISLFAGTAGTFGNLGDGGDRLAATFDFRLASGVFTGGIAIDEVRERLYIADGNNHRVRYVDLRTNLIHAFAGSGQPGFGGDGGPALAARMRHPGAVAVDGLGRVWIADTENHCIRMVPADGSRMLTVAGVPLQPGYSGDGGPAWQAHLSGPSGLACDPFGVVYVADRGNNLVRRITASGRIERYLGNGIPGAVVPGTDRLQTPIGSPADVTVDPSGQVFAVAAGSRQVVRVDENGRTLVIWPPSGTSGPFASSVEVAEDGVVVFGEPSRHRILRVEVNGMYPDARSPDQILRRSFRGGHVHVRPDQSRTVFDAMGRQTEVIDAVGRKRTFRWHGTSDMLESIELENGERFDFSYDLQTAKLTTVTDPAGRVCRATIRNGDLERWEAPGPDAVTPAVTTFTYDGSTHFITSMTPPGAASTTQLTRNSLHQYTGAVQTGVGLGAGLRWSNQPLGFGAVPAPGGGTRANPVVAAAPSDRMTWTDPNQRQRSMVFDRALGVVSSTTDALGNRTDYSYDAFGRVTQVVRPGAGTPTTTYVYDVMGRVLQRSEPLGRVWRYEYGTPFPTPTRITDPRGKVTTLQLHPLHGRPVVVTDPTGFPTSYQYDARGRLVLVSQPYEGSVRTTSLAYDNLDRVTSITDPLGGVRRFTYYADGQLHESFDEMNSRTAFTYTPAGDMATRTDALGYVTRFFHDEMGMLIRVDDAKTNPGTGRTRFRYDGAGRLVERIDPNGVAETFGYDDNGNRTRWTTRSGDTITYVYDAMGRLTQKLHGTTSLATYQYDARGNMTRADNASALLGFTYDAADRLLTQDTTGSPYQPHGALSYAYDLADNVISVGGYGYGVTRSYDDRNLMTAVADNLGAAVTFPRDLGGRRTGILRSNGVNTVWQWDRNNRLSEIRHLAAGGGRTIASWTFSRDPVGNPRQVAENRDGVFTSGNNTYTYDAKHQLLSAGYPDTRLPIETYAYDPVGNRQYGGSANVDLADRLQADSQYTFAYDLRGNMTQQTSLQTGASARFAWDSEGRLVELRDYSVGGGGNPDAVFDYAYDALGRRVRRASVGMARESETFVYTGLDVFLMTDAVARQSVGLLGGPERAEVLATTNLTVSGRVFLLHSVGWTVTDAIGDNGVLVGSRLFTVFGKRVVSLGTEGFGSRSIGYVGQVADSSARGQHGARLALYDIGRFASEDPILDWDASPYSYCLGRPLFLVDRGGRAPNPFDPNTYPGMGGDDGPPGRDDRYPSPEEMAQALKDFAACLAAKQAARQACRRLDLLDFTGRTICKRACRKLLDDYFAPCRRFRAYAEKYPDVPVPSPDDGEQ